MNQSTFAVTQFENRNGVISWRVDGYLHGVRIRKNFKSREEAIAEKATLEIKALQIEAGMQSAPTFLSDVQLREAETAFNRLKDLPRPLSFYLDFALANYREPETQKLLSDAVSIYTEAKDHEFQQDQISAPQLERVKRDLKRLQRQFSKATVAELTAERLINYFNLGKPKLKTYNNRRGIVSTFLKFSFQRGWISENSMAKVPSHRIRRKREAISTFSAAKAEELMRHVESLEGGRFVPYFALCLFAGIRPCLRTGKILRLKPELVNLEAGRKHCAMHNSKSGVPVDTANKCAYTHQMPKGVDFSVHENCVCFNLRRITRIVTQYFDAEMRRHGIRSTQGTLLAALHTTGTSTMAELSEILGMERTTLLRNLQPLQRDGLVNIEGGGQGGHVELSLSTKGRKQIEKLTPAWKSAQSTAVRVLGEERWAAVLVDLDKVAAALKH